VNAGPDSTLAAGRAGRFRRGALATLTSQVIHALGQILLVPVFLAVWGEHLYGEWLTLSAVAAQMALLDLGVQTFVLNRLNQCYARGELDAYRRVLHSALYWCLALAAVVLALVGTAALLLPIESWFRLDLTGHDIAATVAILLGLQVVATVPFGLVSGIYRTVGEYPTGMMVHNVQRVLFFVLTGTAVLAGGGLVHVALVQLVPLVLALFWVLFDLRRRHPELSVGVSAREPGLARSFLGPSSLFLFIRAGQATTIQGSTLLVGALFGAAAVTLFVTLRTLCNLVRQVAASAVHTLWPELTALEARGDHEALRGLHALAQKTITAFSLAAVVALHLAGGDFVQVWTQGEVRFDPRLLDAFLLLLLCQTPWLTSSIFLMATNRQRVVSIAYVASSVLGLALGALLAHPLGLPGLVLGLLAAELLVCGWSVPAAACRLVQDRPGRLFARVLAPAVPVGGIAWLAASAAAGALSDLGPIPRMIAVGLVAVVAVGLATYALWLDAGERNRIRAVLLRG
jgi:O-antigen/teichoic acid export membrane protein